MYQKYFFAVFGMMLTFECALGDSLLGKLLDEKFDRQAYLNIDVEEREDFTFQLFDIIFKDFEKLSGDVSWHALHKFRSVLDGGHATSFDDDCFKLIKMDSMLFYRRYMSGDDLALERMVDASRGFSDPGSQQSDTEDLLYLHSILAELNKLYGKNERSKKFIKKFDEAIKVREQRVAGK